jgi:hypothetical protein
MNNDNLKNSLQSFIAWRKAQNYRIPPKMTRAGMLAYHGKSWVISPDHTRAYFHAIEDFARPVWDSKKDNGRGVTAFYADNFADAVIQWCVVKIAPANKKHNREALYAPITYGTGYEGVTLHLDCAGGLDDARRRGESCTEKLAEEGRENDAQFQAEQQIETAREVIHSLNVKALALIRAIKDSKDRAFSPAICEALRENLTGHLATRTKQFKRIATLQDDYWQAVQ